MAKDHESKTTTDHDTIRRWVEEREGQPSRVKDTSRGGDQGILRIHFPGAGAADDLEPIAWDEFFEAFEANKLAFVYQEATTEGEPSRFCKFIDRE